MDFFRAQTGFAYGIRVSLPNVILIDRILSFLRTHALIPLIAG